MEIMIDSPPQLGGTPQALQSLSSLTIVTPISGGHSTKWMSSYGKFLFAW